MRAKVQQGIQDGNRSPLTRACLPRHCVVVPCNRQTPSPVEGIMSEIVRCEVCGKIFNRSYLGSHKRLAHPEASNGPTSPEGELRMVNKILSLYQQLSPPTQKQLRDRLAKLLQSKSSPEHP